ncbi:MAG: ROK family protein [Lachnospiraceae bacterium]|nr:ROK family protein [Lachnospiraceae bacterium]
MTDTRALIGRNKKNYQRNRVINFVRVNEDASKADIHNATGYSMTTVIGLADELLSENLIYEEKCTDSRIGRKPTWLRLNPSAGYFVGLEFNRNVMNCVVLNFMLGRVYEKNHVIYDSEKNRDGIVAAIGSMIETAINSIPAENRRILAIGLGVPGYIDKVHDIALSYRHLLNWHDVPLRRIVEDRFGIPCFMGNNVDSMIYAYKWLVYRGTCEDMLFVSIRTGVRVVPVVNNHIISSKNGYAGELGHIKVIGGSRLCECGKIGCLNSEISDVAIVNKIIDGIRIGRFREIAERVHYQTENVSMEVFIEAVTRGDKDALLLLRQCAEFLGSSLASLVNLFGSNKIILYGALTLVGDAFWEPLDDYMSRDTIPENYSRVKVEASQFGSDIGALGAAAYAMQESFPYIEKPF